MERGGDIGLGRTTPAVAYDRLPKANPAGMTTKTHRRLRRDKVDSTGKITIRHAGQMHRIGIGRPHKHQPVIALIDDLDIRIIQSHHRRKTPRTNPRHHPPLPTPKTNKGLNPWGSGLRDVSRHHSGGRRGIRTPGTREGPLVFKTNAIVRSAILPSTILASAKAGLAAKVAIRSAARSRSVGEVAESG